MNEEGFLTMLGPLLFAILGGAWTYLNRPEQRASLLVPLTLFLVVGAIANYLTPHIGLFTLLAIYAVYLVVLYVHHMRGADSPDASAA